jgi:hypothetical protein
MIVHNPNNLPTIPIADLLPTQGDLKDLTDKNYQKLKNVIKRRAFSYPVYVWEDENKLLHLLDGHQRQRVLNREGWNEPIPYLKVPAKDLQEAMARLLEITSQYATITQEGIDEFIAKYELPEAEVFQATQFDAISYLQNVEEPEIDLKTEDPEYQQMTFTLHNSQVETVKDAIEKARNYFTDDDINENKNGNALYYVSKGFIES